MCSFVTQRITWKNGLGIIFLENLISVTGKNVFGINFAIISGWGVVSLRKHGQEESKLLNLRKLRSSRGKKNFLVRISSGGVGVFHVKGWAQKFDMAFETQGNQTFWRDILGFLPGYPGAGRKV